MANRSIVALVTLVAGVASLSIASNARAVGEDHGGFPNWEERVLLEWTNRARCDPSYEMGKCGAPCGEAACYKPIGPVYWSEPLNHSARFHSAEMVKQGYFAHDSKCQVASNIKTTYPSTCDGSASCACTASSPITTWAARIGLFGGSAGGEIIATPSDPNSAFYLWLFENYSSSACSFSLSNGHRYNILTAGPALGYGVDGYSSGDFGGGGDVGKIPSGAHYPRSGPNVDLWANWFDAAGPKLAQVNLGGTCHAMLREHGTDANGAFHFAATGVSGCTRYYFNFKDSSGAAVTYPTTGSLGIGDTSCAVWDSSRPTAGSGCDCTPSCTGKTCGPDGCGGSCGACGAGQTCNASGACVASCAPSCGGKTCGADGCGGSCGTCATGSTCNASGACVTTCKPSCTGKSCGGDGCGGSCGACAAPLSCATDGTCACAAPFASCSGACLDVQSDPAHCGKCDVVCTSSEVCSKGVCTSSCAAPLVACDRACVDTTRDVAHCGGCAIACKTGESCVSGSCVAPVVPDSGPPDDTAPPDDGGVPIDSGSTTGDAGVLDDAASLGDATLAASDGALSDDELAFKGQCGCRTPGGAATTRGSSIAALLALGLVLTRRRVHRARR